MPEPIRKLTAIMFTDIAGFTAMTAVNTDKTVDLLNTQRELLRPIVEAHDGTWLREMGDGLLLLFPTASSAVRAAIAIQEATGPVEGLDLRIGIHMGEVREEAGDIYGDAVNLAARIEPFAASGGVALSDRVQQEIAGFPEFSTKYLGQPKLKGSRHDIKIYCLTSHGLPATDLSEVEAKLEKPAPAPARMRWPVIVGIISIFVLISAFVVMDLLDEFDDGPRLPEIGRTIQITRDARLEVDPALSPDGKMIAYAAGSIGRMDIHVRQISGGRPINLTLDVPGDHRWPRWSPDGTRIGFQSDKDDRISLHVVPALGGLPRRLVSLPSDRSIYALAWSPDGKRIAYIQGSILGDAEIHIKALREETPVKITSVKDVNPFALSWSPDGTRIAFSSGMQYVIGTTIGNISPAALWVVSVSDGETKVVIKDGSLNFCPVWTPDGKHLLFLSNRDGSRDIYRLRIDEFGTASGPPARLTTGLNAHTISLSSDGRRLAYSMLSQVLNIWTLPVPARGVLSSTQAKPVTKGNQIIESLGVSADGQWLAFDSNLNGHSNIYRLPMGGEEPEQLTTSLEGDFMPAWSSNGRHITFHSWRTGNRDIFVMSANGENIRQITNHPAHENYPDWSPDGTRLTFTSFREGTYNIYTISSTRGEPAGEIPRLLTDGGGAWARWSPDGRLIAFVRGGVAIGDPEETTLWVVPSEGGNARNIVRDTGLTNMFPVWASDSRSIYYRGEAPDGSAGIWRVPISGENPKPVIRFDDPDRRSLRGEFTSDGKNFYFTLTENESDIWIMELN